MKKLLNIVLLIMVSSYVYSQDLSREIEFYISEDKLSLNNDFEINIIDCEDDTIKLVPLLNNTVEIPFEFCPSKSYTISFIYKGYNLTFKKVSGVDINYIAKWKFKILKYPYNNDKVFLEKVPKNIYEIFIWEFEPIDKDGWYIYEPNINEYY